MRARGMVVVGLTAVVAATVAALLLVPPALAQVPGAPLPSDSTLVLGPAPEGGAFAVVTVGEGWTRIGTGPFLPDDRVSLVSPDGVYRAELDLVVSLPGEGDADAVDLPREAAEQLEGRLHGATWSTESLSSGTQVHYATVVDGADAVTVAVVRPGPPVGDGSDQLTPELVLVAAAPSRARADYRTVTADLVSSIRFSDRRPTPTPAASGKAQG